MSEILVVGMIADTSNPGAAARLLTDIGRLKVVDRGFARIEVVVLENASGDAASQSVHSLCVSGIDVYHVERECQERDASRGRFGRIDLPPGRLPIATARTLLQHYAFGRMAGKRGAVWILDEDLRLSPLLEAIESGEPLFSERVALLRASSVDVAIGPLLGAPPVPARSTVRVNLEDAWRHIQCVATLDPEATWPDRSAENLRVRQSFPEYYYDLSRAHGDAGAQPMWLERAGADETVRSAFARLCAGIGGLLDGIPITRAIAEHPTLDAGSSALARGGNTLVLRPVLLARIPNVAPRIGGRVSRRSDMLWARLAVALEGACIARAPIPVLQDRSGPGRSSFDVDKLLDDSRGSAMVAALDALIGEGGLRGRRMLAPHAVARASAVYVDRVRERIAAIHRSETRVVRLLEQIASCVRFPGQRSGFLRHRAHAVSIQQLLDDVAQVRAAYNRAIEPGDPASERFDVERFFFGLRDEIDAYRTGAMVRTSTERPAMRKRPFRTSFLRSSLTDSTQH